jgi:plasmid stabilization system protein ParE
MVYQIIWSNQAENELNKIFEYYSENASIKIAQKLLEKIISEPSSAECSQLVRRKVRTQLSGHL